MLNVMMVVKSPGPCEGLDFFVMTAWSSCCFYFVYLNVYIFLYQSSNSAC